MELLILSIKSLSFVYDEDSYLKRLIGGYGHDRNLEG